MEEQEQVKAGGRQTTRKEPPKRVTLELPQELWDYITSVSRSNRTKWVIQALQERREREERERVQNQINRANQQAQIYD